MPIPPEPSSSPDDGKDGGGGEGGRGDDGGTGGGGGRRGGGNSGEVSGGGGGDGGDRSAEAATPSPQRPQVPAAAVVKAAAPSGGTTGSPSPGWDRFGVGVADKPHVWQPTAAGAAVARSAVAASSTSATTTTTAGTTSLPPGGTVCSCICGDRVVWHRLIFAGDVEKEKEHECEEEICPSIIIPGLRVNSECSYVEDLSEMTSGTLCQCQCGDKMAWRNRGFYGNVVQEKEKYCLEELCPRINPLPGLRFEARCVFDKHLWAFPRPLAPIPPTVSPKSAAVGRRRPLSAHAPLCLLLAVVAAAAASAAVAV